MRTKRRLKLMRRWLTKSRMRSITLMRNNSNMSTWDRFSWGLMKTSSSWQRNSRLTKRKFSCHLRSILTSSWLTSGPTSIASFTHPETSLHNLYGLKFTHQSRVAHQLTNSLGNTFHKMFTSIILPTFSSLSTKKETFMKLSANMKDGK